MSVKIGTGFGVLPFGAAGPEALWRYVDACEAADIDSIWLSERIFGPPALIEPVVGVAMMAARTRKLKFGFNVLTLPVRDPLTLARQLATLDWLSNGRLFPAFGLGNEQSAEWERVGIPKSERPGRTDEAAQLMRRLWGEDHVTHEGRYYKLRDATLAVKPVHGGAFPIWFGGRSEAAQRRVGRLGDGWLASAVTPEEVSAGIARIQAVAADQGRHVPDDHFGVTLPFRLAPTVEEAVAAIPPGRRLQRPDLPPDAIGAYGPPETIAATLDRYIAAGATKFVLSHVAGPEEIESQLAVLAREIIPRYRRVAAGSARS
jgi:probable F420-dependent oxidoreductase